MSVHTLPTFAAVKVPSAGAIIDMRDRIIARADAMSARDEGAAQAMLLLQRIDSHASDESFNAGALMTIVVLEEIARLPKPSDSILSDASLLAVARFMGFFEAMGYLFGAREGRQS
ncbi:hypothetical protein MASR1M60_26400 [Rhodocyclaceae bacterium]